MVGWRHILAEVWLQNCPTHFGRAVDALQQPHAHKCGRIDTHQCGNGEPEGGLKLATVERRNTSDWSAHTHKAAHEESDRPALKQVLQMPMTLRTQ